MRAMLKLTFIELKLFLRDPSTAFFTLVFPLILVFIFGGIFGNEPVTRFGGKGYVDVSVPGYMGMILATAGLLSMPITLAAYRERGILRRFNATPLGVFSLLMSQVLVNLVMLVVGSLGLFIAGRLVYGLSIPQNLFSLILIFFFCAGSFLAIGFVLASLLPSSRSANAVGMALFFPMLFLSGAAFPFEMLPARMQAMAEFLPLTHVITLLKSAWFGQGWDLHSTLVLGSMSVVALAISKFCFRWN